MKRDNNYQRQPYEANHIHSNASSNQTQNRQGNHQSTEHMVLKSKACETVELWKAGAGGQRRTQSIQNSVPESEQNAHYRYLCKQGSASQPSIWPSPCGAVLIRCVLECMTTWVWFSIQINAFKTTSHLNATDISSSGSTTLSLCWALL